MFCSLLGKRSPAAHTTKERPQSIQDQALILLFRSFSDGRAIDRRHYLSARAGKISFDAIDILLLDHSTILDASEKRRRLPEVEEVIIE